ncbi:MAG TPA: DUF2924 domain-containing protein [Xanthobacteraceae bacterium]|jgi:hypothetical protein|nr:DUF2924 domain-containing protein [Xanthobacteraceae bacterium]
MRLAVHDATARQNSGEPLSVIGQAGARSDQPRSSKIDDIEAEIAGLPDRSTHQLRLAWRKLYRREPPLGLSRNLIIRALANLMQEHAYGGPSVAMKRRLTTLAGEFEKGRLSFDPRVVLKTGVRLVRQWRGHAHTVLVLEDGFEYEGQRYRSLTMIAARITGAHWSGPRFFGVTKRTSRSLSATAPGDE